MTLFGVDKERYEAVCRLRERLDSDLAKAYDELNRLIEARTCPQCVGKENAQ